MKMKKIADVSKKTMRIYLQDIEEGETTVQWAGDGCGMYRLDNAPYLSEQTIFTMFDIDGKKRGDFLFHHNDVEEFNSFTVDIDEKELSLIPLASQIFYNGTVLVAMSCENIMLLINRKYLKPLEDLDEVRYCRRKDSKGREYIVAKDGLLTVAVIYPTVIGKAQDFLADELQKIAKYVYQQWKTAQEEE